MAKDFLQLADYSSEELQALLTASATLKQLYKSNQRDACLSGKVMAMIFEKPSSRTRLSFEAGMAHLGGSTIYLRHEDIGGLGKREPIKDLARVLDGMVNIVVVRTFSHQAVTELAQYCRIPVVNALTDWSHPCQAMADMLTIQEHFRELKGRKLAYIGDGNNVALSLAVACRKLGLAFVIASPQGYDLPEKFLAQLESMPGEGTFTACRDPKEAVVDADVIYTDTWVSMGQEEEKERRIAQFKGYQVNMELVELAGPLAKVMHCLPAYRGLEITDEVVESAQSVIFDQAENRLHFQRALIKHLMTQ